MHKVFIFILLAFVIISSSAALDFTFNNDGCGWGFIPEWDDYETYAFSLEQGWDNFTVAVDYDCYTYRADKIEDAARIDSIRLGSLWALETIQAGPLSIDITAGGAVRFFGDWYGIEIQTGWHHSIAVLRDVPVSYELPFFQFAVPVEAVLSLDEPEGLELRLSGSAGYPFELYGNIEAGYTFGEPFFPYSPAIGYRAGIYPVNSAAYRVSMEKQGGFYIADSISFWPVITEQIFFLQQQWGTGVFGFSVSPPEEPADASLSLQLMLSGIINNSYGIKAGKRILEDLLLQNLDLWITLTTLTGWCPEDFIEPEAGRFSDLFIGAEPSWSAAAGPAEFELSVFLNGGLRQNNFYDINQFEQVPKSSENILLLETGAGVKVLLPFLNDRMLGPAFEIAHQWRLLSLPQAVTGLSAQEVPLRMNLSLTVTGAQR